MSDSTIPAYLLRRRCYLLHFLTPYKHAKHYLGCADDLSHRLSEHRRGAGARLTQVVLENGGSWVVAKTWRGGYTLEARLKRYHSGVKLCPICKGEITLAEVLRQQPPPTPRTPGRRMPMGPDRPVIFARESAPMNDCAWCWRDEHPDQEWPPERSANICRRHADEEYARCRAKREEMRS